MGSTIGSKTPVASLGATDNFALDVSGADRRITGAVLKQSVIDALEALAAGSSTTGSDSIFMLQGGVMKPLDIDVVTQYVLDTIWGKTAETAPDSADKLSLLDGSTEKTVTLALLAEYVRATTEAAILDISDLSTGTPADADFMLITQGAVGKKTTVLDIINKVYSGLAAWIAAQPAASTINDADTFTLSQGGTQKNVPWSVMSANLGDVTGPASTTEDNVPQWDSATRKLKDGLTVQATLRADGVAVDTALATEKGVRTAVDASLLTDSEKLNLSYGVF